MKKTLWIAAALCAAALTVNAADEKKTEKKKVELSEDQKKTLKEIVEKYDANKDGKLDKDERSKISAEDLKKAQDAKLPGFGPVKKKDK
jgi:flagellar capping protein FliD